MSRRKQARPIRVLEEGGTPAPPQSNGKDAAKSDDETDDKFPDLDTCARPSTSTPISHQDQQDPEQGESCSGSDEDDVGPVTCPHCQVELPGYAELAEHSKDCVKVDDSCMSPSASVVSDDEYEGEKRQEEARRQRQDAENNNSVEEEEEDVGFHGLGHVTLKALQNTKVAVAQFAATAMANNADNPAALQELAVLQSTLYTLQHQQMMQLNLIQQLQQQLQITRPPKEGSPSSPPPRTPTPVRQEVPHPVPAPTPPSLSQQSSHPLTPTCQQVPLPPKPETSPPVQQSPLPPCSISSSFASSIITNLDPLPSPSEPNTLEMLQKRAQEVLDNASQGLLANNLADELAFRKSGGKGGLSPYDSKTGGRNEPFFKHRCRYCGKVFGSDSALQIHIRSHTGERPFKCNVCGSRFTTKGNLKVHFQRHSAKFPHIKMNPNPIPEHLDKYHPPLLAQMGAHQSLPPGPPHPPPYGGAPPSFPPSGLPMYRPPHAPHDLVLPPHHPRPPHDPMPTKPVLPPLPLFGPQDMPENLSKASSASPDRSCKEEPKEDANEDERLTPKRELVEGELVEPQERYPSSPPPYDDCSLDSSKYTMDDVPGDRDSPGLEKNDDSLQDQPENLSNKMNGEKSPASLSGSEGGPPLTPSPLNPSSSNVLSLAQMGQRHPPSPMHASESSTSLGALDLTPRSSSSTGGQLPPSVSHSLFSAAFGIPLPPGSMPGSPSPLMSTSALSSLTSSVLTTTAFNPLGLAIGPPGRGNTTCNLCFKTFACNSALEIHYRSHTKERPFKCTICDRGFSTKGNMKQHMLTHKIRDMPAHLFEQKAAAAGILPITSSAGSTQAPICPPQQPPTTQALPPSIGSSHLLGHGLPPPRPPSGTGASSVSNDGESRSSETSPTPPLAPPTQAPSQHLQQRLAAAVQHPAPPLPQQQLKPELGVKRSPPQGDTANMPLPKRQPSLPKHLCHVCNKNFSSSSALQIHMRTHTGDKPFRCSICLKAFTTKGNLKVHMGTHMWTNGASRRGRRMSLELPPLPKDSEFLHRRPDLFYPYLPAPFLNGIHQKLSEMPPMSGGGGGGGGPNGLVPYGGFPTELKGERPHTPHSPPEKGPHPGATAPPSLWDLHLKQGHPHMNHPDEASPPSNSMPPPRGEGLAA